MPGITGFISSLPADYCSTLLPRMADAMHKEGFYHTGLYAHGHLGAYVGWTCHKGSFTDCLPIFNERQDIILFLVGELFDNNELFSYLRLKGHDFDESGGQYLVHLYEELEDDFYVALNGIFAGLLLDTRHKKSFVFNDRIGIKRLFTCETEEAFFFSSEAKSLLAVLPETRNFDIKGVSQFLTCGCTFGQRSLFQNIAVMPGGSVFEFTGAKLTKKRKYFDRTEWASAPKTDNQHGASLYIRKFHNVTTEYIKGNLPLAISLTGGLDSRMVLASAVGSAHLLSCYTFASMYRDTADVRIARRVAATCGLSHHSLVLGSEFIENLTGYLEKAIRISDGYIGFNGAAELFLNVLAREIAPVRITGNYGGELLRNVRAFKASIPDSGVIDSDLLPELTEVQNVFDTMSKEIDPISFAAFFQAPNQGFGRHAVEESQVILRMPFLDNNLLALLYQFSPNENLGRQIAAAVIAAMAPELLEIPTDRGSIKKEHSFAQLTYRLQQEALFKLEYWSNHGMPHWLSKLTSSFPGFALEKYFLGRHKMHHFRSWLIYLEPYLRDSLLYDTSANIPEFFDRKRMSKLIDEQINGTKNWTLELDKLLTLSLIHKFFFSGESFC